jgi:hypothetical protein
VNPWSAGHAAREAEDSGRGARSGDVARQRAGRVLSAVAAKYDDHAPPLPGGGELSEAQDAFRPTGSVLELACVPGNLDRPVAAACHLGGRLWTG